MRRRLPQVLVVVVALLAPALAVSACGGADSLSAGELRAQAGAICTSAARAVDAIPMPASPQQGGSFLARGLTHLRPAAARLRALKPPQALRGQYDRAAQLAAQEVVLIARQTHAIAGGGDPADAFRQLAAALAPLTTEENAYWRALQIPACVRT